MASLEYQIAQAEKIVDEARAAIANHSREWTGADRNTSFAKEDMQRKQGALRDAEATLYNLRAQKQVKTSGWVLAYIAS